MKEIFPYLLLFFAFLAKAQLKSPLTKRVYTVNDYNGEQVQILTGDQKMTGALVQKIW